MVAQIGVSAFAGALAAAVTLSTAIVGLIFRGAAIAWREERDAAVDKADRLEETVREQSKQIDTLNAKVSLLEQRTDYETYAERHAAEHLAILDGLEKVADRIAALDGAVRSTTAAVEVLAKRRMIDEALEDHERRHT